MFCFVCVIILVSILILVFVEVSLDEALRDPHGKDVPHDIGHREAACGPQAGSSLSSSCCSQQGS